jgi:hypothetical protein
MAVPTAITTGVQTVSSAGAVTGTLDVSGLSGDFTLKVEVTELSAAKTAVIALEDTVNNFSAAVAQAVCQVKGPIVASAPKVFSWRSYDLPAFRIGVTSAVVRANVLLCTATPGLKMRAWIEQ